jgi:hypothetical protein
VQHLAAANGACGARAEGDQGANSAGAGVGGVDDAEGAEHALSLTTVLGDLARGPGGLGGAAEVGAVVPGGGGVAVDGGRVRDLGRGPVRGEEGLEVQDVVELHRWDTRGVREFRVVQNAPKPPPEVQGLAPGRTLGASKKCVPTENPQERVA